MSLYPINIYHFGQPVRIRHHNDNDRFVHMGLDVFIFNALVCVPEKLVNLYKFKRDVNYLCYVVNHQTSYDRLYYSDTFESSSDLMDYEKRNTPMLCQYFVENAFSNKHGVDHKRVKTTIEQNQHQNRNEMEGIDFWDDCLFLKQLKKQYELGRWKFIDSFTSVPCTYGRYINPVDNEIAGEAMGGYTQVIVAYSHPVPIVTCDVNCKCKSEN